MAEIHIWAGRIDLEGAQRLLAALSEDFASGRDLGPRGSQIRAIGLSLEQASQELRRECERISVGSPTEDPGLEAARADVLRWRDQLLNLADAFMRLGVCVRQFPI